MNTPANPEVTSSSTTPRARRLSLWSLGAVVVLASYLAVLNAETQVILARQTMVSIIDDEADARVRLLLAVGGSFEPKNAAPVAALNF